MIQTLFVDKENYLNEVEEVGNLRKRFIDVANEAHDLVDQFVSDIILRNKIYMGRSHCVEVSLNLEDVMRSLKSIREEFNRILDNTKLPSCPRTQSDGAAGTSGTRKILGAKKVWNEIVVGLDHDVELIRDKLVEDQKKLDVVSIVGMGGLGKTTLATIVFNDPFILYHFDVHVWVTVSQTYEKRDLLIQILALMDVEQELSLLSYSRLRELLHKRLMGIRYLIVIDDLWSNKAWDDLELFFHDDHTGSRILLTTRQKEVALHANSHGLIHHLSYLTDEKSWELLCKKVFHGDDCPQYLVRTGMRIAKNCRGLPLALVVIAGVLGKEEVSEESWKIIARSVTSYIVNDRNRYIETLALSVNHLPSHLRDCFLYLGGFPKDFKFQVERLIWLWMAEGFIQQDGHQSMEETANDYLMELVDRNLLVVYARKFNGAIKTCFIHDILRELCLEIATKERFYLTIAATAQGVDPFKVAPHRKRRIFANRDMDIIDGPNIRSFLSFYSYPRSLEFESYFGIKFPHSWLFLMVLDLQYTTLGYITGEISLLVHLRYLAILFNGDFPSALCNLWNLQTLIIQSIEANFLELPYMISKLVNLRHLWCPNHVLVFPPTQKPMNLQTISMVVLEDSHDSWEIYFSCIKKLSTIISKDTNCDFKSLIFLETLKITCFGMHITFPSSLKKLTLKKCGLPWHEMSTIQRLPKLEVLKLLDGAFEGLRWDTGELPFHQLKFLKMEWLNIKQWKASSINFPSLKQIVVLKCYLLEEIPFDIGYISTLEHIEIDEYTALLWNQLTEFKKSNMQMEILT